MKCLIVIAVVTVLGLTSAAPPWEILNDLQAMQTGITKRSMKNINAATKKLSELQLNMMKDNQVVAQAEIMSWFSGALDKLIKRCRWVCQRIDQRHCLQHVIEQT